MGSLNVTRRWVDEESLIDESTRAGQDLVDVDAKKECCDVFFSDGVVFLLTTTTLDLNNQNRVLQRKHESSSLHYNVIKLAFIQA
jgi:hypothetical protein